MNVCVECKRCGGSGKLVSLELTRTLAAISTRHATTVQEISAKLNESGIEITAINNRVAYLQRLGFVVMTGKRSKAKLWQRVKI